MVLPATLTSALLIRPIASRRFRGGAGPPQSPRSPDDARARHQRPYPPDRHLLLRLMQRRDDAQDRHGQDLRPDRPPAHPVGKQRLPPRPSARAGPTRRGRGRGGPHHGSEVRTPAHSCRRLRRKTRRNRCSELRTEMAHPTRFERVCSTFGAISPALRCFCMRFVITRHVAVIAGEIESLARHHP